VKKNPREKGPKDYFDIGEFRQGHKAQYQHESRRIFNWEFSNVEFLLNLIFKNRLLRIYSNAKATNTIKDVKSFVLPSDLKTNMTTGIRSIVAKSAISADIKMVCPTGSLMILFSLRIGTTIPSDVVENISVRKSGFLAKPNRVNNSEMTYENPTVIKNIDVPMIIGFPYFGFLLLIFLKNAKSISTPLRNMR
jgi:hypothetical protein